MPKWSLEEIPWNKFNRDKALPHVVSLVKAACMVEYNSNDYARYLCEVFPDDMELQQEVAVWAEEEMQHGAVLRKWAEMADQDFNFDRSFRIFTKGYKLPVNVKKSVRGSGAGELIARCVVESGTSSYYSAIANYTSEPVLKAICQKIAADEFRHYKMFYSHLKRYFKKEKIGIVRRFLIALGRVTESEDDELAYAFFAAHHKYGNLSYDRVTYKNLYMKYSLEVYDRSHIDRMAAMITKAIGIKPYNAVGKFLNGLAWEVFKFRKARCELV